MPWARPVPRVLAHASSSELYWLYPEFHTGMVWDSTIGQDNKTEAQEIAAVQDLMIRALKGPLLPSQQQKVHQNHMQSKT